MLTRKFLKEFENPSNEWRFAPFWFLNHRLTDDELRRQIQEMYDGGLGGFILHARHGLLTPYMSEEWLDRMETCCEAARELGMWAWLYDEDNWPSGTASARVIVEHPEYRLSQLYVSAREVVDGPERIELPLPGSDELMFVLLVPTETSGDLRYPLHPPQADTSPIDRQVRDLSSKVKDRVLKARVPEGRWTVLALSKTVLRGGFFDGLGDTLNKNAMKLFIRYTHDVYAKRLKKYYGKTVKGIFTDEPSTYHSEKKGSVQWSPQLPKEFLRDHKYPLATALPALFFNVGPETAKFRCDFARTALRMYTEAFSGAIYDHCDRRGILSIGHLDCEGELRYTLKEQFDFFAVTQRMHYAGVDTLTSTTWLDERPKNLVSVKLASSAAHLLEKPRVMNESFGLASGWKVDIEELKLLGDWHIILGANYFMPHAFYYSIDGVRKWECPPDEFYHEPYWPYYKRFADRLARLSMVFTGGKHVAPVAVLYPARTGWSAQYGLAETDPEADALGEKVQKTFWDLSEKLLRARLDFDYLSEELLQEAELAGGHIVIRGKNQRHLEEFQVLVLPETTVLDRDSVRAIDDFVIGGGRVYFVGNRPSAYSESGVDDELREWFDKLVEEHPERVLCFDHVDDGLIAHISDSVFRHVSIESNTDIAVLHHRRPAGSFFFLLNTSREHTFIDVPVAFATTGVPRLLDSETGAVHPLADFEHDDGRTIVRMDFAPRQGHLILLDDQDEPLEPPTETADERLRLLSPGRELVELTGPWDFTPEKGNFLPISDYTCTFGSRQRSYTSEWVQLTLTYHSSFRVRSRPQWCRLIVDGLMRQERYNGQGIVPVTLTLNGIALSDFVPSDHYDRLCYETDVTELVRQGENRLEITSDCGGMGPNAHLTQPMVLVGDFAVSHTDEGHFVDAPPRQIATGDWTREGFPYFSGVGVLKQTIKVPEFTGRTFISFEQLAESVEVVLNGKSVGVILWPPYELELTGHLVPGDNELALKIANTNSNLFEREVLPSGLIGRAVITQGTKERES